MNMNKATVMFDDDTKYILDSNNDRYMVTWQPEPHGLYTFFAYDLDELRNILINKECKHTDNVIQYFDRLNEKLIMPYDNEL